ncbi:MAG: nitroreductase [Nevskia sp.]|nr:nitroreductase [Nevskia sp.]
MKLTDALTGRRSVREFLPDPLPRELLQELAEAAVNAPSHMNLQPWAFVAVTDPAVVAQAGAAAKQYLLRTIGRDSPFYGERAALAQPHYEMFYNAPALMLVCATQAGALADYGCVMAAHSLMLAAHAMGLGSCWVSQAQPWLDSADGRRALKLAPEQRPVAPLLLGYPVAPPQSPGRFRPPLRFV